MNTFFADLHIHIGRTRSGKPVKITASNKLTLENILIEASEHKGMDIIGIIDCHVPEILDTLEQGLNEGLWTQHNEGGIQFKQSTMILGSEIEVYDSRCKGPLHVLVYMPSIQQMKQFSEWLSFRVKNRTLSTQRIYADARVLQEKVNELGGLFIPAHIFTPHKSLYGSGVSSSLEEVLDPDLIDAVELGLSSDTEMASQLSELNPYPFLTNSDAHSLAKIGREYQKLQLKEPTFEELKKALKGIGNRGILSNHGLNPLLGKYYGTTCEKCGTQKASVDTICQSCGSKRSTRGVSTRLKELSDNNHEKPHRPPYIHQVPLQFIPGIGPKTLEKLKTAFGTEMVILNEISRKDLLMVLPAKTADYIIAAREGKLSAVPGGGGVYGKIAPE
ncbi:endonuclease Q family protein [Peribacillus frigoritolerans]|uniref:endonuclease Q family protein n=1 Tax=Peribacillus frigoritolerans TaxID=450367 RepID=UPI00105A912C|nr:endonuclease Q family protein [Peribacillus frigoritolerans]TDL82485.1 TIGR00375 family protein [Peribacillus frigoritolerans]